MTARQTPAGHRGNPWHLIYRTNVWRGEESLSGPGSGTAATRHVAPAIVDLVERYGFTSVLDVGCGDGWWMPDLPGYVGIDPSPVAIRRSMERHPERRYIEGDLRWRDDLSADLVIVRDVIQHLSISDSLQLVSAAFRVGDYVLASSYRGGDNRGIGLNELMRGSAYDNDLTAAPFSLGPPLEVIADGYAYEGEGVRDSRKYLGLWSS